MGLAIICMLIFQKRKAGVIKANEVIVPILIIFMIGIGILNIKELHLENLKKYIIQTNYTNWIVSGLLYASYNSILLIPILIPLKDYIKKLNQISTISISVTIIISILAMLIFLMLPRIDVPIQNLEMPAVYVIISAYPKLRGIYGFVIGASIFTTAISLGGSFLESVSKNSKVYRANAILICILAIFISNFGFSNLVQFLYPIFGYLGFVQIFSIFFKSIAKKPQN